MDILRVYRPVSEARAFQAHGRETRKTEEWRYHSPARETASLAEALVTLVVLPPYTQGGHDLTSLRQWPQNVMLTGMKAVSFRETRTLRKSKLTI
jgi:hypothetical protein